MTTAFEDPAFFDFFEAMVGDLCLCDAFVGGRKKSLAPRDSSLEERPDEKTRTLSKS